MYLIFSIWSVSLDTQNRSHLREYIYEQILITLVLKRGNASVMNTKFPSFSYLMQNNWRVAKYKYINNLKSY